MRSEDHWEPNHWTQSGFCSPKVMEILARELEKSMEEITKSGGNSRIIEGINKDVF